VSSKTKLSDAIDGEESQLIDDWLREFSDLGTRTGTTVKSSELREQCGQFLRLLRPAVASGIAKEPSGPAWEAVRDLLAEMSRAWGLKGFSPTQTASFVLALKAPVLARLQSLHDGDAPGLIRDLLSLDRALDSLGLYTTEIHQKAREEMIARQQLELLELSTPVVKLWEGILALPLIGTLDSARTQVVMESLLQRISETGAPMSIIDITGVPTVDTLVAQHLLKTITAARLMGADCIISGMRPQIAQTIVHLGVELGNVVTKASLADAFALALRRVGLSIRREARPLSRDPSALPERREGDPS
jgi:rsbT co-antagonist protein RsbR